MTMTMMVEFRERRHGARSSSLVSWHVHEEKQFHFPICTFRRLGMGFDMLQYIYISS